VGKLIYTMNVSLDGYVEDSDGGLDWTGVDDELHAWFTEELRPIDGSLYGRRLYDTMTYWETPSPETDESPVTRDYQRIWAAARKIVYSSTLDAVASENTTIERVFDPEIVAGVVGRADTDVSIGGAHLAAHALRAGLVGELRMFLNPVVVGDGTPFLPDGYADRLDLLDERRFENGVVYVRYSVG